VIFGMRPATAQDVSTADVLTVTVPPDAAAGPVKVHVVRPPGAESEMLDFNVLDPRPSIRALRPGRIVLGLDNSLVIEGSGFLAGGDAAEDGNAVLVDGRELADKDGAAWTDRRVTVTLPRDDAGIKALQLDAGSADLVVLAADGSASEPKEVEIATTRPLAQVKHRTPAAAAART
jgi:hypothetical protein